MALTGAQLIAEVRGWSTAQVATISDTQILSIANRLMRSLARRNDLWFLENVFQSDSIVAIPPGREMSIDIFLGGVLGSYRRLLRPTRIFFQTLPSGEKVELNPLLKDEFDYKYPFQTAVTYTGSPIDYMILGRSILLGPTPASSTVPFSVWADGYFEDDLLTTAIANSFTAYAEDLVIFSVLDDMVMWGFEEDTRQGMFKERARECLREILAEGHNRQSLSRRIVSQRKGTVIAQQERDLAV